MDHTNNTHYLQHITRLGGQHRVIAREDIYLANGSKLLAAGKPITPDAYLRIIQHKLVKPIDTSVILENALTPAQIEEQLKQRIRDNPLLSTMSQDAPLHEQITDIVQRTAFEKPLLIKLTVLKDRMPLVYQHSLDVAVTALFLGLKNRVDVSEQQTLLISGLFHDIGMLHIDPGILNQSGSLSDEQRRSIYSHPVIGSLILEPFSEDRDIPRAILEHHEHCDGAGYPKGLHKMQLGLVGRLLAVAELAASLQDHASPLPHEHRLGAILKFNQGKYAEEGSRVLLKLFHDNHSEPEHPPISMQQDEFRQLLSSVWSIIAGWTQLQQKASTVPQDMREYINHRLYTVERALVRSGLSQNGLEAGEDYLDALLERPCEIMAILNEAMYQFKNTINELTRRWPDIALDQKLVTAVNDWIDTAHGLMNPQPAADSVVDFTADNAP